jgi:hypothetical protein
MLILVISWHCISRCNARAHLLVIYIPINKEAKFHVFFFVQPILIRPNYLVHSTSYPISSAHCSHLLQSRPAHRRPTAASSETTRALASGPPTQVESRPAHLHRRKKSWKKPKILWCTVDSNLGLQAPSIMCSPLHLR